MVADVVGGEADVPRSLVFKLFFFFLSSYDSLGVEITASHEKWGLKSEPGCTDIWHCTAKLHNGVQITLPNLHPKRLWCVCVGGCS